MFIRKPGLVGLFPALFFYAAGFTKAEIKEEIR
jgi:hypothetical protein